MNVPVDGLVRITYCYICNDRIVTERRFGDLADRRAELIAAHELTQEEASLLDANPVHCSKKHCEQIYGSLPNSVYAYPEIPLSRHYRFDGNDFLSFPARATRLESSDAENDNALPEQVYEDSLSQAWLFFGLLSTFFKDRYDESHFLRINEVGQQIVTSRRVPEDAEKWVQAVKDRSNSSQSFQEYNAYLNILRAQLAVMTQADHIDGTNRRESLRATLAFVGSILAQALNKLFSESTDSSGFVISFPRPRAEDMQSLGWCPFEAPRFFLVPIHVGTTSCFSAFKRPHSMHSSCNMKECLLRAVDETRYVTPHLEDCNGHCEPLQISSASKEHMNKILEQGRVPLAKVITNDVGHVTALQFVDSSTHKHYVAISHVWSHGLGNPRKNTLLQCQLKRIQALVKKLDFTTRQDANAEPLLLWMDTLCCPLELPHRSYAIKLMKKTYQDATHVLVLDQELQNLDTSLRTSVSEVAGRIIASDWTHRLWTLQEGAFAQELWIQLGDRVLNVYSLWLALRDVTRSRHVLESQTASDMTGWLQSITIFSGRWDLPNEMSQMNDILSISLARRTTTKSEDEPLLVNSLLRLDSSTVVDEPSKSRIFAFWNAMSASERIPRTAIFHMAPKLIEKGYSWAPKTLLGGLSTFAFINTSLGTGRINNHRFDNSLDLWHKGLDVTFPGCLLRFPNTSGRKKSFLSDLGPEFLFAPIRDTDGRWFNIFTAEESTENTLLLNRAHRTGLGDSIRPNGQYALICRSTTEKGTWHDCFVEIVGRDGATILCKHLRIVLRAYSKDQTALPEELREDIDAYVVAQLPETQIWSVD